MFALIVNPVSGGGRCAAAAQKIAAVLKQRGLSCRQFDTLCERDGMRQTRLALEAGYRHIVCIGGDGTLGEVAGALAGTSAVLYLVPCGTGNDFARALGLHGTPEAVFESQLDGNPSCIDCGRVNDEFFINVSGSGFDVEVLTRTEELKAVFPGRLAYYMALFSVISRYRPFEAELSVDGGSTRTVRGTVVEIANGQYIGGGMRVAPQARCDDGLFDVVIIRPIPRLLISLIFPLFLVGLHTRLPLASCVRARRVTLKSRGMILNIDGRLVPMDEARYELMPDALHVMLPSALAPEQARCAG